jgi:hypothetical protein
MKYPLGSSAARLVLRWMVFSEKRIDATLPGKRSERAVFAVGVAAETEFEKATVMFARSRFVRPPLRK